MLQFDDFKKCYGEILYRWGLREKRADVLKFASCPPEPHKGIGTFLTFTPETSIVTETYGNPFKSGKEIVKLMPVEHRACTYLSKSCDVSVVMLGNRTVMTREKMLPSCQNNQYSSGHVLTNKDNNKDRVTVSLSLTL